MTVPYQYQGRREQEFHCLFHICNEIIGYERFHVLCKYTESLIKVLMIPGNLFFQDLQVEFEIRVE